MFFLLLSYLIQSCQIALEQDQYFKSFQEPHNGPGHLGSESRALNLGQLFHFQTELLLNITLWKKIKEFNCLIKIENY